MTARLGGSHEIEPFSEAESAGTGQVRSYSGNGLGSVAISHKPIWGVSEILFVNYRLLARHNFRVVRLTTTAVALSAVVG